MGYQFLLDIAIILLSTKVLGLLTKRFHMPQVVGALLAGLLLGPAMFGVLTETEFLTQLSEVGVIVLMFCAGLETEVDQLKKAGLASFIIALLGVLVPLGGGFLVACFFNSSANGASASVLLQNLFIGVILTATSVSITVETLKEMGKLNTKSGNAILGAAVIDDVLGIIALTVITSLAGGNGDSASGIGIVLLKIVLFFVFLGVVGYLFYTFFRKWTSTYKNNMRRFVITAFVFCLLMAYFSETLFGVADITGAFFAGLIISCTEKSHYISARFDTLSYLLLSPVFFASIGLKVELPRMTSSIILFSVVLAVVAVLTKIIGCGLGAKIMKYSNKDCLRIGVGMISRGEVALIVANKGEAVGLLNKDFMGPIIIVVLVTTIIAPILLPFVYRSKNNEEDKHTSPLLESVESMEKYQDTTIPK